MKKIIAFCFIFLCLASCSTNNDDTSYSFEVLPVESVDIPSEFTLGITYPITVNYFRPSTCHSFKEFYYLKENNIRTVAPVTYVLNNNNCEALTDELVYTTFNFIVTSIGSYIFKFWQGEDDQGEPIYLNIEVPVVE